MLLFHINSANYSAPTSAFTTSTMRCTNASQTSCVGASAITRISGSVPDGRTRIRHHRSFLPLQHE